MEVPDRRGISRVRVKGGDYASFPGGTAPIRVLGLDGVTLEDPDPMPFDSFVRLELHLGTELIGCTGRVTQSDPDAGIVAIRFTDLSTTTRRSLMSYLAHAKMLENRQRLNEGLNGATPDAPGAPPRARSFRQPRRARREARRDARSQRLVGADQLSVATAHQREHGGLLPVILMQFAVVSEDDLAASLHREYRVPLIDLSTVEPTTEVLQLVPLAMARAHAILPIGLSGSTLTVAIADPSNIDGLAAVNFPAAASCASRSRPRDLCSKRSTTSTRRERARPDERRRHRCVASIPRRRRLVAVALSCTGTLAVLRLTGSTVDPFSQIGLILLVGLVTKNSILIVEFADQLRGRGMPLEQATFEAS